MSGIIYWMSFQFFMFLILPFTLRRFRHPPIVSLYGYHLSPGSPSQYLVYEFASRGSLDTFYASEQSMAQ